jgi:hypothetical protein
MHPLQLLRSNQSLAVSVVVDLSSFDVVRVHVAYLLLGKVVSTSQELLLPLLLLLLLLPLVARVVKDCVLPTDASVLDANVGRCFLASDHQAARGGTRLRQLLPLLLSTRRRRRYLYQTTINSSTLFCMFATSTPVKEAAA